MQGFNNSFKKVTIPISPINTFHDRPLRFSRMDMVHVAIIPTNDGCRLFIMCEVRWGYIVGHCRLGIMRS